MNKLFKTMELVGDVAGIVNVNGYNTCYQEIMECIEELKECGFLAQNITEDEVQDAFENYKIAIVLVKDSKEIYPTRVEWVSDLVQMEWDKMKILANEGVIELEEKKFQLTENELFAAYKEQKQKFAKENIQSYVEDNPQYKEYESLIHNEDFLLHASTNLLRYEEKELYNYEDSIKEAIKEAMDKILEKEERIHTIINRNKEYKWDALESEIVSREISKADLPVNSRFSDFSLNELKEAYVLEHDQKEKKLLGFYEDDSKEQYMLYEYDGEKRLIHEELSCYHEVEDYMQEKNMKKVEHINLDSFLQTLKEKSTISNYDAISLLEKEKQKNQIQEQKQKKKKTLSR